MIYVARVLLSVGCAAAAADGEWFVAVWLFGALVFACIPEFDDDV